MPWKKHLLALSLTSCLTSSFSLAPSLLLTSSFRFTLEEGARGEGRGRGEGVVLVEEEEVEEEEEEASSLEQIPWKKQSMTRCLRRDLLAREAEGRGVVVEVVAEEVEKEEEEEEGAAVTSSVATSFCEKSQPTPLEKQRRSSSAGDKRFLGLAVIVAAFVDLDFAVVVVDVAVVVMVVVVVVVVVVEVVPSSIVLGLSSRGVDGCLVVLPTLTSSLLSSSSLSFFSSSLLSFSSFSLLTFSSFSLLFVSSTSLLSSSSSVLMPCSWVRSSWSK